MKEEKQFMYIGIDSMAYRTEAFREAAALRFQLMKNQLMRHQWSVKLSMDTGVPLECECSECSASE